MQCVKWRNWIHIYIAQFFITFWKHLCKLENCIFACCWYPNQQLELTPIMEGISHNILQWEDQIPWCNCATGLKILGKNWSLLISTKVLTYDKLLSKLLLKFLSVKFDLKMKRTDHNRSGKFGGWFRAQRLNCLFKLYGTNWTDAW